MACAHSTTEKLDAQAILCVARGSCADPAEPSLHPSDRHPSQPDWQQHGDTNHDRNGKWVAPFHPAFVRAANAPVIKQPLRCQWPGRLLSRTFEAFNAVWPQPAVVSCHGFYPARQRLAALRYHKRARREGDDQFDPTGPRAAKSAALTLKRMLCSISFKRASVAIPPPIRAMRARANAMGSVCSRRCPARPARPCSA